MAEANPLRCRGYYYLNSRYYDPKIGRFINADSYVSTGQGIVGYNMFAYCGNNPVSREDAEGRFWDTFFDIFSLGVSIYDVFTDPTAGWAWAGLVGDAVDLIPFVTGVGEGTKALGVANKVDNVHDAAKVGTDVVHSKFDELLNCDYYKTDLGYDCSEIAQDFYDAAGHKGKIYRIEGNNGYIKGYEYNVQVEYIYHEVYSDGIYIYDPRYVNVPILKDDYFRALREINPFGFDVFEIME